MVFRSVKDDVETCVWASGSVRKLACQRWRGKTIASLEEVSENCVCLIAVGGGHMMDEAKYFRTKRRPEMRLILSPSIWGSGAEGSPIVVLNRAGSKIIENDPAFLPDEVIYWPELLQSIPVDRARQACGDVWAHAMEAFLSPLSCDKHQAELASLIDGMLQLPLTTGERWFEASLRACQLQARSSVGLVHGIAHVLEAPVRSQYPSDGWGHAKLCSVLLWPVMELNQQNSPQWSLRCTKHNVNEHAVWDIMRGLHEHDAYRQVVPLMKEYWPQILRDPCTRANGTLVRRQAISWLDKWGRT